MDVMNVIRARDDRAAASGGSNWIARVLEAYGFVAVLLVVVVFFSIWPATASTFPSTANAQAILGNQTAVAFVAMAALIPLICGQFDLSVGANMGMCCVVFAHLLANGTSGWIAAVMTIVVGIGIGLVNAVLVTVFHVDAVIVTLGVSTLVAGAIAQITGGVSISGKVPATLFDLGAGRTAGIPNSAIAVGLVALGLAYVLSMTPYGRYLYALGSSKAAARLVGLRTGRLLGSSFVVAGAIAALGALVQVSRAGGADPRLGDVVLLQGLAAVFLSAAVLTPGRYNLGGTLIAIAFLAILNSGLNLAGVQTYLSSYVNGGALLLGVGLAVYLWRRRRGAS